ncbi:MAG: isoleucine--tRNA ligase [Terriglobia bacterium]
MELKETLNLPKTAFPMKANLPTNEPQILQRWEEQKLYEGIRQKHAQSPLFTLHDGPPYANGNIHLGHAENKILKDFIVKSRNMMGFNAPYLPGWDCHGLPIEIKVDQSLGKKKASLTLPQVRQECRKYAEKFVGLQRQEFKRLGILGEWDRPYLTMSFEYEAAIARTFAQFVEKGHIYKGLKPVYWCISCQTALAEAEVEYENHTSPSIYVKFPVLSDLSFLEKSLAGKKISVIIWTTTPWTLPANLGIAFNSRLEYSAVEVGDEVYVMASELIEATAKQCGFTAGKVLARFPGSKLERLKARHPFLERDSLLVLGDHVTLEQGTGCVHIAPGHGQEDYITGKLYGLDIYCPVNSQGQFIEGTEFFAGMNVFEANPKVVELLRSKAALLASENLAHSYPHCWRCHNPVIFRATPQWFISMDHAKLRESSLEAIRKVQWIPEWGEGRIANMVATRPDWCISRQRVWGVPIIVFYCDSCNEPILKKEFMDRVVSVFEKEGSDAWFQRSPGELLPPGVVCPDCGRSNFRKETDILDVWFDSGSSHEAVLGRRTDLPWPADLYIEGGDQYRGWFQSSLLIGMGIQEQAPYRQVLTHGWTLDADGKAMSKSLGNVIEPQEVVKESGAEILRAWVAASDFKEDVRISKDMLARLSEFYRRFRNTARWMLANLYDYSPSVNSVPALSLSPIDQWALQQTALLLTRIQEWYRDYEFHRIFHAVNEFVTVQLSSLYFDILKDRLYTAAPNSVLRRSSQTSLYRILDALTRAMAPIYSFTSDEIWQYLSQYESRETSVHMALFRPAEELIAGIPADTLAQLKDWDQLIQIRGEVLKILETARKDKFIGSAQEAKVQLAAKAGALELLRKYQDALPGLFIVSQVEIKETLEPGTYFHDAGEVQVLVVRAEGHKCERCWNYALEVGQDAKFPTVCGKCSASLKEMGL